MKNLIIGVLAVMLVVSAAQAAKVLKHSRITLWVNADGSIREIESYWNVGTTDIPEWEGEAKRKRFKVGGTVLDKDGDIKYLEKKTLAELVATIRDVYNYTEEITP